MFKNHTLTHSFYLVTTKLKFILTVINIIWNEDSGLHRYKLSNSGRSYYYPSCQTAWKKKMDSYR